MNSDKCNECNYCNGSRLRCPLRIADLGCEIAERLNWIEANSTIAVGILRDGIVDIFTRAANDRSYRRRVIIDVAIILRHLNDAEYCLIVRHEGTEKALQHMGHAAALVTEALQK